MDRHSLWIKNDSVKRKYLLKLEAKRLLLRSLRLNSYAYLANRLSASFKLTKITKHSSKSFMKNRCVVSGRSFSLDNKTALSRFVFRKQAYKSTIPGLKRASW